METTETSVMAQTGTDMATDGRKKARPGLEQQKANIVQAAVSLFLEKGVRTVSISQICREAEVSRPTFYRCFEDIDALLEHIYQFSVLGAVESFMLGSLESATLSEGDLKDALGEMYDSIFEQSQYAELLFREANNPQSPASNIVNEAFDRITGKMQKMFFKEKRKEDAIYIKSLLNAYQWIAHDAISSGLSKKNRELAKEAAWQLLIKNFAS